MPGTKKFKIGKTKRMIELEYQLTEIPNEKAGQGHAGAERGLPFRGAA